MHPCPCCGYKTLPERGDYDVCPVCWWEDEGPGLKPWEISGPNAQTLIEAQQEYLAETRPYSRRPGGVRAPRRKEARDPDWRPFQLTDEVMERVARANEEMQRWFEKEERQAARELAEDPEGPFKEFNASLGSLRARSPNLSHRDVLAELRDLRRAHDVPLPDGVLEITAREMKHENFYRHHLVHAAWWVLRYARPGTYRRAWRQVRAGEVTFAG
jgi:hypothetical protein